MSSVIDDYLVDPKVSLLDKTRMQAQVLVPVLRALRAELGNEKADAIVKQALRDWSKQLFASIGEGIEGSPRRKWATINSVFGEVSGKEVEVTILRHDQQALDIDVTRCRFAEFFRALGEPELGALLICEAVLISHQSVKVRSVSNARKQLCVARRAAHSAISSHHDDFTSSAVNRRSLLGHSICASVPGRAQTIQNSPRTSVVLNRV